MPKQAEAPGEAIRLSTNCIWEGKFYNRGEPLPVASVADLPENLQKVVAPSEPEAEEPANEARGSFELGVLYELTDDGRLGRTHRRRVERQLAQLQAEADYQEALEEEAAADELPLEVAESLQEAHQSHVALQTAQQLPLRAQPISQIPSLPSSNRARFL